MHWTSWLPRQAPAVTSNGTSDFLAAIELWKAQLFAAERREQELLKNIDELRQVFWTGADVDPKKINAAVLKLITSAAKPI